MAKKKIIPIEALFSLKQQLESLAPRSETRRALLATSAAFYQVSPATLRRSLQTLNHPKLSRRKDYDCPRILAKQELLHYCEMIAAMKVRTSNKKGRHLPTTEIIRLLEEHGIETPQGLVKVPVGLLKKNTVNRYLRRWELNLPAISIEPVAVRFQAEQSNECWHFDMSPSDFKPRWLKLKTGQQLMLFSAVDDRSGVSYQEYRCVYGEDAASALKFLFNAMSAKSLEGFAFQGIPSLLYLDNGPVAKSAIFQRVMACLGVEIKTHLPQGRDSRRSTARSKGKVERPFRTVKELHETLYHFHEPQDEEEANTWLMNYLLRYNQWEHRHESHSRFEDWLKNLPLEGFREMCSWERFASFAREPEQRKVMSDATVSLGGIAYQLASEFAGKTVTLWQGLFDNEIYVEQDNQQSGPFYPAEAPIPLGRYRTYKKTSAELRADKIESLAKQLSIPKSALSDLPKEYAAYTTPAGHIPRQAFIDPDPYQTLNYRNTFEAKRAISAYDLDPLFRRKS